ncbi:hypothetical protein FCOIX_13900 [Fusarium coicis]|nr:hypothetical protein FCOIX_13900 [Fusarium coicis]
MSLRDYTIVVTGASNGIGKATALHLAAVGAKLGLIDIVEPTEVLDTIEEKHGPGRAIAIAADVSVAAQVDSAIAKVSETLGPLRGKDRKVGTRMGQLKDMDDLEWDRVVNINLNGVKNCTRAELRHFSPKGGSIVNASSKVAQEGAPFNSAYAASKAGVALLTKSVAKEVAEDNIRINAIAPGIVDTALMDRIADTAAKMALAKNKSAIGRPAQPDEIVKLIEFLLSENSSYCTGACETAGMGIQSYTI